MDGVKSVILRLGSAGLFITAFELVHDSVQCCGHAGPCRKSW